CLSCILIFSTLANFGTHWTRWDRERDCLVTRVIFCLECLNGKSAAETPLRSVGMAR
ncbi:unnamed protein product, partial [Pelagomonas calceolata]